MNEKESIFWKVAPILFWAFYVIFLLSSVPHVTEWYRHLDGAAFGAADLLYWGLAAGKAIAIDGADVLLTLAFLRLVTQMKSGWDGARLFIIVLCIVGFTIPAPESPCVSAMGMKGAFLFGGWGGTEILEQMLLTEKA